MTTKSATQIAELKASIAKTKSRISRIQQGMKRLDAWDVRVKKANKENARVRHKLTVQSVSIDQSRLKTTRASEVVNSAKEVTEIQDELDHLEWRKQQLLAKLTKNKAVVSSELECGDLTSVKMACKAHLKDLEDEWKVPIGPDGRPSMALCPQAMREKYWRRDWLLSKYGSRDPNAPGSEYRDCDFADVAKRWGWSDLRSDIPADVKSLWDQ
jgi:hypothetical protein